MLLTRLASFTLNRRAGIYVVAGRQLQVRTGFLHLPGPLIGCVTTALLSRALWLSDAQQVSQTLPQTPTQYVGPRLKHLLGMRSITYALSARAHATWHHII